MSKSKGDRLAIAVDTALIRFDKAVKEYLAEMHRLNAAHVAATQEPHPIYSRGPEFIAKALCDRQKLAKMLGIKVEAVGYALANFESPTQR